jgi:5-methylcytosine-specific restriction endonuclease McrA
MNLKDNYKLQVAEMLADKQKAELSRRNVETITFAYCKELLAVGKCARCGRSEMLTIDHIIPKTLLRFFMDAERELLLENYQVLCRPCNQLKSAQLDFSIPQTKELLLKLLERV